MKRKSQFLLGCLVAFCAADVMACSLAPYDETMIKQKLASGIADRLGWSADQVNQDDITAPQFNAPLPLGADCSGVASFHHSAGFQIKDGRCVHEGVAVLLGYWHTNPVAVNVKTVCGRNDNGPIIIDQ